MYDDIDDDDDNDDYDDDDDGSCGDVRFMLGVGLASPAMMMRIMMMMMIIRSVFCSRFSQFTLKDESINVD